MLLPNVEQLSLSNRRFHRYTVLMGCLMGISPCVV